MSKPDFTIGQGDTASIIRGTFKKADGSAYDLTGCTVTFLFGSSPSGAAIFERSATVVDADAGEVQFNGWQSSDVATAGWRYGQFRAVNASAQPITAPNTGPLLIQVAPGIAAPG